MSHYGKHLESVEEEIRILEKYSLSFLTNIYGYSNYEAREIIRRGKMIWKIIQDLSYNGLL